MLIFKSFEAMRAYYFPREFELEQRKKKKRTIPEAPPWFTKKIAKAEFIKLMDEEKDRQEGSVRA